MLNPQNRNAEIINKQDKKIPVNLSYLDIEFPLNITNYELIENRFEININVFGYENKV